eukprot:2218065-Ditylum_brightwellii.AAC.1
MKRKCMLYCFPQYFEEKRPPAKVIQAEQKQFLEKHIDLCKKPSANWRAIQVYNVSTVLSHADIESIAKHELLATARYHSSLLANEAYVELHTTKYFTTDNALAATIHPQYMLEAPAITL